MLMIREAAGSRSRSRSKPMFLLPRNDACLPVDCVLCFPVVNETSQLRTVWLVNRVTFY